MPSFGTLVLVRLLEHYSMPKPRDFGVFLEVYRKRSFLTRVIKSAFCESREWVFSEVRLYRTRLPHEETRRLPSAVLHVDQCQVPRITQRANPTNVVLVLEEEGLERRPLLAL